MKSNEGLQYLLFWIVGLRGQSGSGVAEPIQYQSGCEASALKCCCNQQRQCFDKEY